MCALQLRMYIDDKMGEITLGLRAVQTAAGAVDGKNWTHEVGVAIKHNHPLSLHHHGSIVAVAHHAIGMGSDQRR